MEQYLNENWVKLPLNEEQKKEMESTIEKFGIFVAYWLR